MSQYTLVTDKKISELEYALNNYNCDFIFFRAFSLGKRIGMKPIYEKINNDLTFKVSKEIIFYKKDKEILRVNYDRKDPWAIEYQNEKCIRIWPYVGFKNESIKYSTFLNVLDDYLIEIYFKGKINLEEHSKIKNLQFYKIKR